MPNDNEQKKSKPGILKKLAGLIQGNSDSLYRTVHYSDPLDRQQLDAIKSDMMDTIKNIMSSSSDTVGEPNISRLYERLLSSSNLDKSAIASEFERIFGNNEFVSNLTASYLDNRWVKAVDTEIDEILKYMPKLQEALDVITDNVLSADSFNKDYLNLTTELSDAETSDEQFAKNIMDLKETYELLKLIKDIYRQTSKYGECFVYRVPYQKAIQRLMDRKDMHRDFAVSASESGVFIESATDGRSEVRMRDGFIAETGTYDNLDYTFTLEHGMIRSIVETEQTVRNSLQWVTEQSIFHEAIVDIDSKSKAYAYDKTIDREPTPGRLPVHRRFDQTLGDHLELPDYGDPSAADGLYDREQQQKNKIKGMNGCIVKILKRERVVPIILNQICLGYYYFEFDNNIEMFDERLSSVGLVNTLTGIRSNHRSEAFDALQRREELLRNISNELAKKINPRFIDANQDLKKEIYYILKYNDEFNALAGTANNIRVSYIPPEDIKHFYFNLDEDTGRGISDLYLSMVPAKLWVAIYVTNCLGVMTRSNDKRVYYVRQNVESNTAKTLLKTINEIKRGNFNIRQIENIHSVLNITGRFNDYIIPQGPDGQSPIDFQVMQGQNIEIKTELLSLLEESAINIIGVPLDIIQNRQSPDYAIQFTMSNSKFLRFVYDRQANFQVQVSDLVTDIYDVEFGTTDRINLTLPPPLFINVTNTNQLVTNTLDYSNNIANIIMADSKDDVKKQKFVKEFAIHSLGSYINMDIVKNILDKVEQSTVIDSVKSTEDENGNNGGGGY